MKRNSLHSIHNTDNHSPASTTMMTDKMTIVSLAQQQQQQKHQTKHGSFGSLLHEIVESLEVIDDNKNTANGEADLRDDANCLRPSFSTTTALTMRTELSDSLSSPAYHQHDSSSSSSSSSNYYIHSPHCRIHEYDCGYFNGIIYDDCDECGDDYGGDDLSVISDPVAHLREEVLGEDVILDELEHCGDNHSDCFKVITPLRTTNNTEQQRYQGQDSNFYSFYFIPNETPTVSRRPIPFSSLYLPDLGV